MFRLHVIILLHAAAAAAAHIVDVAVVRRITYFEGAAHAHPERAGGGAGHSHFIKASPTVNKHLNCSI